MVFEVPVVPLAIPSVSSVLALLCQRVWINDRNGLVVEHEDGVEVSRALLAARAIRDRTAISVMVNQSDELMIS